MKPFDTQIRVLTDDDLMPNGIHKGKKMVDISAQYLCWIYDHQVCREDVRNYIKENLKVLRKQAKEEELKMLEDNYEND